MQQERTDALKRTLQAYSTPESVANPSSISSWVSTLSQRETALWTEPHVAAYSDRLPRPANANLMIPTSRLLGYRGPELFFYSYAPGLPETTTGEKIPSLADLEMRPLKDIPASELRVKRPIIKEEISQLLDVLFRSKSHPLNRVPLPEETDPGFSVNKTSKASRSRGRSAAMTLARITAAALP